MDYLVIMNLGSSYNSAIPLLCIPVSPREKYTHMHLRRVYKDVYSNIFHYSLKMDITHVSINNEISTQVVVYSYNALLHSNKSEQQLHVTTFIHFTNLMLNKRINIITFHVYKFQIQAKLHYTV